MSTLSAPLDAKGSLAVVRLKPLGAGGGGIEASAGSSRASNLSYTASPSFNTITVEDKTWKYPAYIVPPESPQELMNSNLVESKIDAFMEGHNVNVMAYGQTGSGKTHTMFGPPGIMARAGSGQYGFGITADYGKKRCRQV